jgi:hypothetical protein
MHILLKSLLKEVEEESSVKYQFYCDMDGVLVDMDKGFKKISGGLLPKEYESKNGKNSFWKIVNQHPNFWIELEPLPDAKVLWDYIKDNFKDPLPVILSAGQGEKIKEQKTAWVRKHIDPSVKVIIADSGINKPNYIINNPNVALTHILLDDTEKNITAWENSGDKRIALLHKNAADSIKLIQSIISK